MIAASHRNRAIALVIGGVWVFHGLWSKVLGKIPRHEMIVGTVLGDEWAPAATLAIGLCEILLGLWVFTGCARRVCATVQTVALVSMNTLEIIFARDLLISAPGMVGLNVVFLALIWRWVSAPSALERSDC